MHALQPLVINLNKFLKKNIKISIIISGLLLVSILLLYLKKTNSKKYKIEKIKKLLRNNKEDRAFKNIIDSDLKIINKLINDENLSTKNNIKIQNFLAKNKNTIKIFEKTKNQETSIQDKKSAINILSYINTIQSIDYLITFLYEQETELIHFAIEKLSNKNNNKIIETFMQFIRKNPDIRTLKKLKKTFKKFGPEATKKLTPLMQENNIPIKIWYINLLSSFEEEEFTDLLINHLKENRLKPEVKISIMKNLKNINCDEFDSILINYLEDDGWGVRCQAVKQLGERKIKKAASKIYRRLEDNSGIVRDAAAKALIKLDNGLKYLLKAAKDTSPPQEVLKVLRKQDIPYLIENIEKIYASEEEDKTIFLAK